MTPSLTDPTPHSAVQREAIAAGVATLVASGLPRARFSMACGTGKTFTQLKLSEALLEASGSGPRRILVLVPSLSLVRQSRDAWAASHALGADYSSLCVCSDPSLKAGATGVLQDSGEDHVDLSPEDLAELGIDAATTSAASDIARINAWLDAREKGPQGSPNATSVIFSTYQSSKVVGMALAARAAGDRAIDVGVFDEAHRTAGAGGRPFSFALSDRNIQITKRVFFTATERVRDSSRSAKAQDWDDDLVTMDDEAVYGPRAYSLSFRQAAERGLTVPVKIIISVVDDEAIARQNLGERAVHAADGQRLQARGVANLSAVSRAMQEYNLRKVITFHGGVDAAQGFSRLPPLASAADGGLPGLQLLHVSGRQGAAHRREQMLRYERALDPVVISNARCLTEGVDVPATDMVAFMDPKRGAIDIVQAIGRAQRKAPGKEVGYALLPLHVSVRPGESDQQVLDRAAKDFQQIRDVLSALAENDEAFMAEVRRTVAANAASPQGAGADFGDLPVILLSDGRGGTLRAEELARAIRTRVIGDALGESDARWEVHFAALQAFKEEHGHCDVPAKRRTDDGLALGRWLGNQRQEAKQATYPSERRERMKVLGVRWSVQEEENNAAFETRFAALMAYKAKEGHCDVPFNHRTDDGLALGIWLTTQRQQSKKPTYPSDRRQRLESLGVRWSLLEDEFEKHFAALTAYKAKLGHCDVPQLHKTDDDLPLGKWLARQRQSIKKSTYPRERRERMEALGVRWKVQNDGNNAAFEKHFAALVAFKEQFGHCDVSKDHRTNEDVPLGKWLITQRNEAKNHNYPSDRRQRLESLGVRWNLREDKFEKNFAALAAYKADFGHCDVPYHHETDDGQLLGQWLSTQRKAAKKSTYPRERREKFEELGVRLTVKAAKPSTALKQGVSSFSDNLVQLAAFANANGSCNVPPDHELFPWCQEQIQAADDGLLSPDHLQQLIDVGLIENPGDNRRMSMRG